MLQQLPFIDFILTKQQLPKIRIWLKTNVFFEIIFLQLNLKTNGRIVIELKKNYFNSLNFEFCFPFSFFFLVCKIWILFQYSNKYIILIISVKWQYCELIWTLFWPEIELRTFANTRHWIICQLCLEIQFCNKSSSVCIVIWLTTPVYYLHLSKNTNNQYQYQYEYSQIQITDNWFE